jgi:hypothetical protein
VLRRCEAPRARGGLPAHDRDGHGHADLRCLKEIPGEHRQGRRLDRFALASYAQNFRKAAPPGAAFFNTRQSPIYSQILKNIRIDHESALVRRAIAQGRSGGAAFFILPYFLLPLLLAGGVGAETFFRSKPAEGMLLPSESGVAGTPKILIA